jgi:hypothetical protein
MALDGAKVFVFPESRGRIARLRGRCLSLLIERASSRGSRVASGVCVEDYAKGGEENLHSIAFPLQKNFAAIFAYRGESGFGSSAKKEMFNHPLRLW